MRSHRREFDYVYVYNEPLYVGRRCQLGPKFGNGNVMVVFEDGTDITCPRSFVQRSDSYAAIRAVRERGNG